MILSENYRWLHSDCLSSSRCPPPCLTKTDPISNVYIFSWRPALLHRAVQVDAGGLFAAVLPSRIAGMQCSCTGVGLLTPSCLHCFTSQSERPSDEKSAIYNVTSFSGAIVPLTLFYSTLAGILDVNAE